MFGDQPEPTPIRRGAGSLLGVALLVAACGGGNDSPETEGLPRLGADEPFIAVFGDLADRERPVVAVAPVDVEVPADEVAGLVVEPTTTPAPAAELVQELDDIPAADVPADEPVEPVPTPVRGARVTEDHSADSG